MNFDKRHLSVESSRPDAQELLQMYVRKDEMTQDDLVDVMHDTFAEKPDKNVPSVEQILNEEDKKEEESKKEPEEKKETGPDFENMSLTE